LSNSAVVLDVPALQTFLQENGYVRDLMDTWDEEDVAAIRAYLRPAGKKALEKKLRAARG
jgi:hypothetical protein